MFVLYFVLRAGRPDSPHTVGICFATALAGIDYSDDVYCICLDVTFVIILVDSLYYDMSCSA